MRDKYVIIHAMEAHLPFSPFEDEWAAWKSDNRKAAMSIGGFEVWPPWIFGVGHIMGAALVLASLTPDLLAGVGLILLDWLPVGLPGGPSAADAPDP